MGKLRNRITAAILLVVWITVVCAGNRNPQHRGVGTNSSQTGDIIYFILFVCMIEYGKKLDKGYICPVYCEVKHKHRIIEYETKAKQSTDEKADPGEDGSALVADRQQPEGGVRHLQDTD